MPPSGPETVVGQPKWEATLVWLGFPLLGAALGALLEAAVGWALSLRWIPFRGPLELVDSAPEPQVTIGAIVVGAVLGFLVSLTAAGEVLTVTVTAEGVRLTRDGNSRDVPRSSVAEAFVDGKALVLLGPDTAEIARENSDLAADRLRVAFVQHGYPWRVDGDPYREHYRRWVEGAPELPVGANAVLKARARAVEKGDQDDAAELRDELAKLGVVVRDQDKRQYWRLTGRPADRG